MQCSQINICRTKDKDKDEDLQIINELDLHSEFLIRLSMLIESTRSMCAFPNNRLDLNVSVNGLIYIVG